MKALLNAILHYFLFAGTIFFAAGAPAIGAPSVDSPPASDSPSDAGGESEPAEGDGGDEATESTETPETPEVSEDGRRVPNSVRKHLAELKKTNPELAKELSTAYWESRKTKGEIERNFPGGLQEAVALKTAVAELGEPGQSPTEALQSAVSEIQDFRAFDKAWMSGDPKFLDRAIADGGKDGFVKLMPHMLQTFASVDPAGYDSYFAGAMWNTLRESDFAPSMYMALEHLKAGNVDAAKDLLSKSYQWVLGLKDLASRQPEPKKPDTAQVDQERQQLQTEKKQFLNNSIGSELKSWSQPLVFKALEGKTFPGEGGKEQVYSDAITRVMQQLNADANFVAKYDSYIEQGDKDGAIRLVRSRAESLLSDTARQAYKRLYGQATLGAQKPKPGAQKTGAEKTVVPGFKLINFNPKPSSIDRSKTPNAMLFSNQAILKDGSKVTWKHDAPSE